MRLLFLTFLLLMICAPLSAADPSSTRGMIPFVVPLQMDCSAPKPDWIERPAGKCGPVQSRNGHFYTGSKRIRFWGVNLCWGACFPSHDEAKSAAAKLASLGVNIVRIHNIDSMVPDGCIFGNAATTTRRFDPVYLDRLDYFVSQLKAVGIYIALDLFVDRRFQPSDGEAASHWDRKYKAAVIFDPELLTLQKEFAKQLLDHRNPYTGLAYREEPALALIGIANETSMYYQWNSRMIDELGAYFGPELDRQFRGYLARTYGSSDALSRSWGQQVELAETVRPRYGEKGQPVDDFMRFAWESDRDYFTDMCQYVKSDLGFRGCVTGSMAFGLYGGAINQAFDHIEMHAYWNHPTFTPEGGKVSNSPMVDKPAQNPLEMLQVGRVKDKPFAVMELNHPFPSYYDAEMLPLVAAYAANQDWDAVALFDFHASTNWHSDRIRNYFEVDGHPVKTVQMLAASAAFLRDLPPAPGRQVVSVTQQDAVDIASKYPWASNAVALRRRGIEPNPTQRFYIEFGKATASAVSTSSDNSCFQWTKGDDGHGVATVISKGTKMAIGRISGKPIDLGDVSITPGDTATGYAAVTITALGGSDLATAKCALLTATARCANIGMVWATDAKSIMDWGRAPALAEPVPVDIRLPGAWRAYALNPDGSKATEIAGVSATASTSFSLTAPTIWYALERP